MRVRVTDSGGLWFDEVFTLTAAEVNEAPTGVSLSNTTPTIFENASTTSRIKVADIVITDDALVTDTVTLTGTDSGSFEVDRLELFLKSGVALDFETKQSYAVTVNVADASIPGSAPVTAGFTLTVADVNDLAPAFTSGPTGSVAENAEISTAIYTAATTDTDGSPANRAVTYSIKPGVGDASLVQIDAATGVVTLPASANFELNPSYAFTVVATNAGTGATLVSEQAVTVAVSDVNEAPTGAALTSTVSSLPENTSTASRIKVADIAITDDALGTNTITLSGADSGSFEVDGLALFLKSGVTLNFETKQSYAVTVSVADASIPGSTPVTMGFTLSVTNTNETPTDITLPPTNIAENAGVNAVVGLLGTVDPDAGNTFTYTLVAGTGSTDNASFNILGNELRATASLDFEARRYYSVRVRSTDQGGLFTEEQFPITVTDIVEMQFVTVGNVGNSPDPATGSLYGAVNYQYQIGAYEVTTGQYTAFLNAVAQSDPYSLYSTSMASDLNIAGIARSGTAGSYTYSVMNNGGDSSDRPITYVSWFDAARFANWMHNGQPRGAQGPSTTERGAYTLDGQTSGTGPARNSGAAFHIPTENEWYKAAYYSPVKGGPGSPGYSAYATQSDTAPGNTIGNGANQANYYAGAYSVTQAPTLAPVPSQNYLTNVGAFTNSASYYGTFDQDGNVWEVSEVIASESSCTRRGGSWNFLVAQLSSFSRETSFLSDEYPDDGFRLARPVADPSNVAPTDVTLSATSIAENAGSNALVGTFTTTDPDAGNTFTYALVSGTGSTDNAAFNISGNQLRASASLDFETRNSYSIRVRAFDQGGLFTEHTFTITVTNIPVEMQFRTVGNAGSGGVAYEYRIGTYEVTNAEYATFLSAVAGTDAHGLYSEAINGSPVGGITRTGSAGSYAYAVKSNMGDKPVTFVNWFDVARFANWMHNGQPSGPQGPATTERGAYTLDGQTSGSPPPRSPEARFAIPNQAEWRKAAYYAPTIASGAGGFYAYATQSDSEPAAVTADAGGGGSAGNAGHFANYGRSADWNGQDGNVTTVGSNGGSSFYGTFDQNGNVSELTEETSPQSGVPHATILGGNWLYDVSWLSTELAQAIQTTGQNLVGFRLARPA